MAAISNFKHLLICLSALKTFQHCINLFKCNKNQQKFRFSGVIVALTEDLVVKLNSSSVIRILSLRPIWSGINNQLILTQWLPHIHVGVTALWRDVPHAPLHPPFRLFRTTPSSSVLWTLSIPVSAAAPSFPERGPSHSSLPGSLRGTNKMAWSGRPFPWRTKALSGSRMPLR